MPFIVTILGIYCYFRQQLLLSGLAFGLMLPSLSILYALIRNFKKTPIDIIFYVLGMIGFVSDATVHLGETGKLIQVFTTTIFHWLYIIIFLKDRGLPKKILGFDTIFISILVYSIIFTPVFLGNNQLSDTLFFLSIIYTITQIVLFITAYLYSKAINNWVVALGVAITLFKDILFANYFYKSQLPIFFIMCYLLNILAYFLITISVANQQNLVEKKSLSL